MKIEMLSEKSQAKDTHGGNIYKISRELGLEPEKILDFSANINPLGMPLKGQLALEQAIHRLGHYPDPEYFELRKTISIRHGVPAEWIVPTNGAIEGLFLVVRALMPQKALVCVPSFSEYKRAVESAGGEYVPLYRNPPEYEVCEREIEKGLSKGGDLLILCNPNNPTGTLTPAETVRNIFNMCQKKESWLIVDEAFMDFAQCLGAKSIVDSFEAGQPVISLHSITKFYAVPGLRAGYIICPHEGLRKKIKEEVAPWQVNEMAAEFVKAVFLDEQYKMQTKKWFCGQREKMYNALKNTQKIKPLKSWANYIFFRSEYGIDVRDFLLEKNIVIRDCNFFDGLSFGDYRVAIRSEKENEILQKALAGLGESSL